MQGRLTVQAEKELKKKASFAGTYIRNYGDVTMNVPQDAWYFLGKMFSRTVWQKPISTLYTFQDVNDECTHGKNHETFVLRSKLPWSTCIFIPRPMFCDLQQFLNPSE